MVYQRLLFLSFVVWDVRPEILRMGPLAVRWYGVMFALLFWIGFYLVQRQFRAEGNGTNCIVQ